MRVARMRWYASAYSASVSALAHCACHHTMDLMRTRPPRLQFWTSLAPFVLADATAPGSKGNSFSDGDGGGSGSNSSSNSGDSDDPATDPVAIATAGTAFVEHQLRMQVCGDD